MPQAQEPDLDDTLSSLQNAIDEFHRIREHGGESLLEAEAAGASWRDGAKSPQGEPQGPK
jgi:hypothetical protein